MADRLKREEINVYVIIVPIVVLLPLFIYYPGVVDAQIGQNHNASVTENNTSRSIPWFGIVSQNVTKGIANILGMDEPNGILITDVSPGSPAEKAQLQGGKEIVSIDGEEIKLGGDIITKADNKTITIREDLVKLVRQKEVGDKLTLIILRDGTTKDVNLTLGSRSGLGYEDASNYINSSNIRFLQYENMDLHMSLQHPLSWEIQEYEGEPRITIRSLPEDNNDLFSEYLTVQVLPSLSSMNMTLDEVIAVNDVFANETFQNLTIVNKPHTTILANNSARTLVFDYTHPYYGDIRVMRSATQKDDSTFMVSYFASSSKFDSYLPTIEKMVNSFDIIEILSYEDLDSRMRMKYPSAWTITEEESFFPFSGHSITLLSPAENNPDYLEIIASEPLIDQFAAEQKLSDWIKYYETLEYPNFKLIKSNSSHLTDKNSFHNVTYSYGDPIVGTIIETHLITVQDNRVYSISYLIIEKEENSNGLAIIDQMIKSIKFFKPIQYIDDELGLVFRYPSDTRIDQTDNRNVTIYFGPPDTFSDFTPQLEMNSYENGILEYNKRNDNVSSTKMNMNTTTGKIVVADGLSSVNQGVYETQNMSQYIATFNDRVYNFSYSANTEEYDRYIETVRNIMNSMRIIDSFPVEGVDYNLYNSSSYGFEISYPSGLNITDGGNGILEFFDSGNVSSMNMYNEYVLLPSGGIVVEASENSKLYDRVEEDIRSVAESYSDFDIISSNQTKYRNNDAYDLVYTADDDVNMNRYILNEKNKNLYIISYNANVEAFYSYLPIMTQMINSLEFNQISKPITNTGFKVGDGPFGLAVNPVTNMIYVANGISNTVSVINGSNDKIVTNVPVSSNPSLVAINTDKNMVYVTHNSSVSVINGKNNSLIDIIQTNVEDPLAMVVNPYTDKIYIGDSKSKNITVLAGNNYESAVTISTGTSEEYDPTIDLGIGLSVDSIRNRIYVANPSTSNITVIDGTDNSILANISASYISPYDIAVDPLANVAYIISSQLSAVDLRTNEIEDIIPSGGFNVVTLNPFTKMVYATDSYMNSLIVVDPTHNNTAYPVKVDSGPTGIAVNPNTGRIYTSNYLSDTVSKIKINGTTHETVANVAFNINPLGSGYIECNYERIHTSYHAEYPINTECEANANDGFLFSSWSGDGVYNMNSTSNNVTISGYGGLTANFERASSFIGDYGNIIMTVVVSALIVLPAYFSLRPSVLNKASSILFLNQVDKMPHIIDLSDTDILGINGTVIAGVLIFLSLEGFEGSEEAQVSIITAYIVLPFAISAIATLLRFNKFGLRLMIAGFVNLMIATLFIALLKL